MPVDFNVIDILNTQRYEDLDAKIVNEYDQEIPQSQTADKPMAPRGRATQQSRYFYLCISIYCDLRAVQYQLLVNFITVGPQGSWGSGENGLGEWLFIFRELGCIGYYFQGFWEHAHSFGDLERALQEKKKIKSYLKGKAFTSFDFFKSS